MPGKLIVIDGTDGSGKTTQVDLLVARLKREGREVEFISFPRYETPTGEVVREYLDGHLGQVQEVSAKLASILYAEDRYAAKPEMEGWLKAGKIVIANRYVAANMGHQGGKIADPEARCEFMAWNDHLEHDILRLPRPDLNVILHMPAAIGQRLSNQRDHGRTDIHQQDLHHLKNAEATYLEIARTYPNFTLIECAEGGEPLPREQIHEKVWVEISKII